MLVPSPVTVILKDRYIFGTNFGTQVDTERSIIFKFGCTAVLGVA
jgi:hypothetical protein